MSKTIKIENITKAEIITYQKLFNKKTIECLDFLGGFIPEGDKHIFRAKICELEELNKNID